MLMGRIQKGMWLQRELQMTDHLGSSEWGEGTEDIGSRTHLSHWIGVGGTDAAMGERLACYLCGAGGR